MHLVIAAQKAILNNPDSSPEQKERALAELRGIPEKDPRYADAQQVLSELGQETTKASPAPPPEKRKQPNVTNNAMFWCAMGEMQYAVDRFERELEAESKRLAEIMVQWTTTDDDALLNSFNESAPAFVEKSLEIIGLTWEEIRVQLQFWARMYEVGESPAYQEKAKELYEKAEEDAIPVMQATILITTIWPAIKGNLAGWRRSAKRAEMPPDKFAKLSIYARNRAEYEKTGIWPGGPEWRAMEKQ